MTAILRGMFEPGLTTIILYVRKLLVKVGVQKSKIEIEPKLPEITNYIFQFHFFKDWSYPNTFLLPINLAH